jgi:hypothetical protein
MGIGKTRQQAGMKGEMPRDLMGYASPDRIGQGRPKPLNSRRFAASRGRTLAHAVGEKFAAQFWVFLRGLMPRAVRALLD